VTISSASRFTLTDDERDLLPSADDVESYAKHGWYLSKKLFTDDDVDELIAASDRYYAGERDRGLPVRPPHLASWDPSKGDVQRHNDYVHYEHDGLAKLLRKPLIGAVAAALARADEIRVFQSTMIFKPPIASEPSNIVPWHFDKHYWSTSTSDNMLTALIPFHDCDEEMGTITMVDGSHRWQEIGTDDSMSKHFAERDNSDLERVLAENAAYNNVEVVKVPMNIPKGHMSFHHCRIYHGSGANRSPRPRRAISFHLQDGANSYRPYILSTGETVAYNHDVLVRRQADGHPDYSDPDYCPVTWHSPNGYDG